MSVEPGLRDSVSPVDYVLELLTLAEGERETIGADRLCETMVFRIGQNDEIDPSELGFEGYNDEGDAERGHVRMCERWGAGKPAEKADNDER